MPLTCSSVTNLADILGVMRGSLGRGLAPWLSLTQTGYHTLFPTSQSSDSPALPSICFCERDSILTFTLMHVNQPPLKTHLELKSQKPFRPLSFVSMFFPSAVKLKAVFLSVRLVISSSVPSFFIYVNKAARGAAKWWQHTRAYRRAVCLQYIIESAQLKGWECYHLFMLLVLL